MPSDNDLHRAAEIAGKAVEAGAKVTIGAIKIGPKIGQAIADKLKDDGIITNGTMTGMHLRHHIKGCSEKTHSGLHIRKHLFG
jgi:hypothetical protein